MPQKAHKASLAAKITINTMLDDLPGPALDNIVDCLDIKGVHVLASVSRTLHGYAQIDARAKRTDMRDATGISEWRDSASWRTCLKRLLQNHIFGSHPMITFSNSIPDSIPNYVSMTYVWLAASIVRLAFFGDESCIFDPLDRLILDSAPSDAVPLCDWNSVQNCLARLMSTNLNSIQFCSQNYSWRHE
jgi:hypothetical protein